MKKVFNWIKKNRSKIFVVLAVIIIAMNVLPINEVIQSNNVYAQINQEHNQETLTAMTPEWVSGILGFLLNTGTGVLGGPLSILLNCFAIVIFVVLYTVFQFMGVAGGFNFPFPDQIIFNQLAFFDPNFINPPSVNGVTIKSSPVAVMQGLIQDMYYSFFILAGTIFVIAAMVIGIKLALSTIASQKAQYKAALTNWVMGLVLLFTVHFLMAGIFYINEQIVETAYKVVEDSNIESTIDWAEVVAGIGGTVLGGVTGGGVGAAVGSAAGRPIASLFSWATSIFNDGEPLYTTTMSGYSGYIITLLLNAASGDLVSSIIVLIILGQTVSLVVTYTKRLFYCILLGMMAPVIVAIDVIKKSMA